MEVLLSIADDKFSNHSCVVTGKSFVPMALSSTLNVNRLYAFKDRVVTDIAVYLDFQK